MHILVLSDSHGDIYNLEEILKTERYADMIIHCGDGADDMYTMTEYTIGKPLYIVKGNCDSIAHNFALQQEIIAENKKLLVCHGDAYGVRYGLERICLWGHQENADLCLFGHTHCASSEYDNGLYLFNPGSVKDGKYGTIDIDSKKVTPLLKSI